MEKIVSQVFQAFGAFAAILLVVALLGAKYLEQWLSALVGARVDLQVKAKLAEQQHEFNRDLAAQKKVIDEDLARQKHDLDTDLEERRQQLALVAGAALERVKHTEGRRAEVERVMAKYRGPLLQAAYDLQSRLFNIVRQNLLTAYLVNGSPEERAYTIDNTLFLVAQYFAWTEIIRREVQLLDLGGEEASRKLSGLRDDITGLWRTDAKEYGKAFRVFAGDQRAIGERMVREGPRGPECLGYAEFRQLLRTIPDPFPDLASLRADLVALAGSDRAGDYRRLVALQRQYIDLLALLDPAHTWYPAPSRQKLPDGASPNDARPPAVPAAPFPPAPAPPAATPRR